MANITNLPILGSIKTGGERVIALNQQNIDMLKKAYANDPKITASNNAVSNKDLLTQNFAIPAVDNLETINVENNTQSETITPEVNSEPVVENPIEITAIPTSQNNDSLESSPVNMSMEAVASPVEENVVNSVTEEVNNASSEVNLDPLSGLENLIPNTNLNITPITSEITSADNQNVETTVEPAPITPTTPEVPAVENATIESPFQVTNAPNIFDLPPIEPINVEVKDANTEVQTTPTEEQNNVPNIDPLNVFAAPLVSPIETTNEVTDIVESNDEISEKEILLEKETAELYEKLAQNSRKKIELLEQKIKKNNVLPESNTVPSASELFNPNGTLNDNKVLEVEA